MSEPVFGIDLGTTYSAIAYMRDGTPTVIENREGDYTTPSVVFFESESNFVVGKEAKNGAILYPDTTIALIKRQMGSDLTLEYFGKPYKPETISALILKDLVDHAREQTGIPTDKVVITVPAYFGIAEKEATRSAGTIAGLDVVGIVTEPVAAALSAGITGDEQTRTLFVYDLGGGTFDCTIMEISRDRVDVVVIDGNRRLGGADWDMALFELVARKFTTQAGIAGDPTEDEDFSQRLIGEVETAKKTLSRRERASIRLTYGDAMELVEITRQEFEDATAHLVDQTLEIVQRTLRAAAEKRPELTIDEVLLVGGSARMPMIEASLTKGLGWKLRKTEFDLAVAKGAAIYGSGEPVPDPGPEPAPGPEPDPNPAKKKLFLDGRTVTISNVLSKGIGIRFSRYDASGRPEEYIGFIAHKNDNLPLSPAPVVQAATFEDGATSVVIHLYEQSGEEESEQVVDNTHLPPETGSELGGLPNLPAGSPLELTLNVNTEGIGVLTAFEPVTNQRLDVEVRVSPMSREEQEQATQIVAGMTRRDS